MINLFLSCCYSLKCSEVREWQMECTQPEFDNQTWVEVNCQSNNTWTSKCLIYDEIICEGDRNITQTKWCPCGKGKSYRTAVILSFLFGYLGIDRFYLGYASMGILKLFTGGFFGIGYLVDLVFIINQKILPTNGDRYIIEFPFPLLSMKNHSDIA